VLCAQTVAASRLAEWYEDHMRHMNLPRGLLVAGISAINPAMCTHLTISCLGSDTYPRQLLWGLLGFLFVVMFVGWTYWLTLAKSIVGIKWCEHVGLTMGALGAYVPKGYKKAGRRRSSIEGQTAE
jgi:hypothetical protein